MAVPSPVKKLFNNLTVRWVTVCARHSPVELTAMPVTGTANSPMPALALSLNKIFYAATSACRRSIHLLAYLFWLRLLGH
jgi:hypothetical protein